MSRAIWIIDWLIKIIFLLILILAGTQFSACNVGSGKTTPTADIIFPETLSVRTPGTETQLQGSPQASGSPFTMNATKTYDLINTTGKINSSGIRVVYTNAGNLWLWEEGNLFQLTDGGLDYFPIISSDGERIAFLRQADRIHHELWAIDSDGLNERRLVGAEQLDAIGGGVLDPNAVGIAPYRFQWIPDSHTLAFNTQQFFSGSGFVLLDDLNLVEADSLEVDFLLLWGWGGNFYYSPDGKRVAIATQDTILLMDADGKNYQLVLPYDPVFTYSDYRYYAMPFWSQDSSYLRVALPPIEPLAGTTQMTEIWRISADGSEILNERELEAIPFFEDPYGRSLVFSPDMQYFAYLIEDDQTSDHKQQLRLVSVAGHDSWTFREDSQLSFEAWSLDSKLFVFIQGEDQQAWLGNVNGDKIPFRDNFFGVIQARWVDVQRLILLRQQDNRFDIILTDIQSNHVVLDTITGAPPAYDYYVP